MTEVMLELTHRDGSRGPLLVVSQLPGKAAPHTTNDDFLRGPSTPAVELQEGRTYRYVLQGAGDYASLQPAELFDPDDASWATGRLSTGEAVGTVTVEVELVDGRRASGRLDVRPTKVADEHAFQSMLQDLAEISVEALHQGFSASAGSFAPSAGAAPRLLYQRFALLHAYLFERELDWAIEHVLADPHRSWVTEEEPRRLGEPIRGSSRLGRTLTRPGPRSPAPYGPLETLPHNLTVDRSSDTVDTVPNRYVRFVLESWRLLAVEALEAARSLKGSALRRGVAQAERTINRLDELLAEPLFRQVSPLSSYPQANPVLLRREGYRQITGAAFVIESSLGLELDLEDPFLVSRRSIATLYEHWSFVRLARAVAAVCDTRVDTDLFDVGANGMSLVLRSGHTHRLQFTTQSLGAPLAIDLLFNRTFALESWTQEMRPDASLLVRAAEEGALTRDYWLHFDAKYRVDRPSPLRHGDAGEEEDAENAGTSKRTDLLKMHAYRDAIRNSAASYVLFPGDREDAFPFEATELLPALGAFPLRPDRAEEDAARLEQFVRRVLVHVADAATRHGRARYWEQTAYEGPASDTPSPTFDFLDRPPADTPVLCGYVRSAEQWRWIEDRGRYNLRTGDRRGAVALEGPELEAHLVMLYGAGAEGGRLFKRSGPWMAFTSQELAAIGYPQPREPGYLVTQLTPLRVQPTWLSQVQPERLRPAQHLHGSPFVVSWLSLSSLGL